MTKLKIQKTNKNSQLVAIGRPQSFHSRHIMKKIRGARGGTF
jgi:hypothetical protein